MKCYIDGKECPCVIETDSKPSSDFCPRDPFRESEDDEEVTHLKYLNGITDDENLYE